PDPTADRGKHSMEYSLYPHSGTWRTAGTVRRGYEFNYPLIGVMTDAHKGALPEKNSFVQLQPSNLVLTSIKKAEDSDAWIIQWYDARGEESQAILTLPRPVKRALLSNFLEDEGKELTAEKNVVRVNTKKSSVVTLKVNF
ncbi:MAG: alpha-mannosidase, partial [Ignavibacteria bacterium]|nr:alpha-mannosidase [Ignavibacteria bacterium]